MAIGVSVSMSPDVIASEKSLKMTDFTSVIVKNNSVTKLHLKYFTCNL